MKIGIGKFSIDIQNSATAEARQERLDHLEKASWGYDNQYMQGNMRSHVDYFKALGGEEVRVPYYPLQFQTLYDVALYSDTLRTIHNQLRKEIFRNGIEIEEKLASKCTECEAEYEHPKEECEQCGSTEIRKPDPKQRELLESWSECCNLNEQSLVEMGGEVNNDLEKVDDGYIIAVKEYFYDEKGDIVAQNVREFVRGHPVFMRIIADRSGRPGRNSEGLPMYIDPDERGKYYHEERHPKTGKQLLPAYFRGESYDQGYLYYGKDEVFHKSKYDPSLTYGFPTILTVWLKVTTLMNQDRYMNRYYNKERPPRGLLFVKTANRGSLEKSWMWMLDMFKKNPHQIPPIAIEGDDSNRGKFVEFVDFMRSLDEMQFVEQREEFRRTIGALYGVMPMFQGDMSQGGGLNNEGLQVTVTNRAIEEGQRVFNDGFFKWMLIQLNITDYTLKLAPNEEKDEMADEQLFNAKARNAAMMQQMGWDVTLNEDNEFEYSPIEEPVQPRGEGGLSGLGGALPGSGMGSSSIFGTESGGSTNHQRFSGEPQNVRRSVRKEVTKQLKPIIKRLE